MCLFTNTFHKVAKSAEAVEYTDCFSEFPRYDAKQSDGEVPLMLELWRKAEYAFNTITTWSTLARSGST